MPEFQKIVLSKESSAFVEVQTSSGPKELSSLEFELAPDYADMDLNKVMYYFYYPLFYIQGHMQFNISPIASKFTKYSLFFYYFCHSLGLTYILYYLI